MNRKILLFTSEFPPLPGGIGNHALHLAVQFQKNGYEVTVVTDQRNKIIDVDIEFDSQLELKVIRIKRRNPTLLTYLERIRKVYGLIQKNDIIFASGKFPLWLIAFMHIFFTNKKFVAVVHGSELGAGGVLGKLLTKWSLKQYHKLIAVSNFTRQLALERQSKVNITVINNGFAPKTIDSDLEQKETPLSIITVGNVTSRKGQQNVIKALPELKKQFPSLVYHIVGLPTEKQKFTELAQQLEVEESVIFHGALSDEALHKKLSESKVFCMLSNHLANGDVEGFGIAVLEANHLGLPAIGSINSGIADAIKDGISGKLVDPHNPTEITLTLTEIINNYEHYSLGAKEWSEYFRWERIIKKYIEVIEP